MNKKRVLWVDDEIHLLKPHIIFLEEKGFEVSTTHNGTDALDMIEENTYDIVLLDENMPGLSGLETLLKIKEKRPSLPVVMITKSEEEAIMEEAIGSKISDYLIKPVNPKQILLSLKKNLESKKLVSEKSTGRYQREFREIAMMLMDNLDFDDWKNVYKKLVYWEMELEKSNDPSMFEILTTQKKEANALFGKYVSNNYLDWLNSSEDKPVFSHTAFKELIFPQLEQNDLFLVVIDNLRYDQFQVIKPYLRELFEITQEHLYYSILPTATQYARNAFFAGLMPLDIKNKYPGFWTEEADEESKNNFEKELLTEQLSRYGYKEKISYQKILNPSFAKKVHDNVHNLFNNSLNVIVYNFVDMLSHARTNMEIIKELAQDDSAYRSLTRSWFEHSPLYKILKTLAENRKKVCITTDHGTIKVTEPSKVIGDKNTSTNLRYKQGKQLQYNPKDVFAITNPDEARLPKPNVSTSYIFALEDKYFVYPNNYNYYVNFYKNTFQHGGVSMEEIIVPCVFLQPK
ncbi:MAG: PglZ domain-containing protein [Bacteroidetes bacterium]|nr:MAG: PglZ domain-containing protein [Bacteroidota bacterium]